MVKINATTNPIDPLDFRYHNGWFLLIYFLICVLILTPKRRLTQICITLYQVTTKHAEVMVFGKMSSSLNIAMLILMAPNSVHVTSKARSLSILQRISRLTSHLLCFTASLMMEVHFIIASKYSQITLGASKPSAQLYQNLNSSETRTSSKS